MIGQIERIKDKISLLKKLDKNFEIFGSETHKYLLNKTKSEKELSDFEEEHGIILPKGYREFMKQIGNGGVGPYYGLEPIENGIYADLSYKDKNDLNDLSKPFPHTEHWNLEFRELKDEDVGKYLAEIDKEYYENKWADGLLKISNFGCGVSINLVVNGKEYGNIWVDDRCNDQGIYPDPYLKNEGRITFLDWYELWLDKELKSLKTNNSYKEINEKSSLWSKLKSIWS